MDAMRGEMEEEEEKEEEEEEEVTSIRTGPAEDKEGALEGLGAGGGGDTNDAEDALVSVGCRSANTLLSPSLSHLIFFIHLFFLK